MIVYLDLAFFANALADALGLYLTAKLCALPVKSWRIMAASFIGGTYGVLCLIPPLSILRKFYLYIPAAALLTYIVFGRVKVFLRILVIYFLISFMLGGAFFSISRAIATDGLSEGLQQMNWKVFMLVSGIAYFVLSFLFRGSMKHAAFGEILCAEVLLDGRKTSLNVLLDTGHTLRDPYSGEAVLTVWYSAVEVLFPGKEWEILRELETEGCIHCLQRLSLLVPGKFSLIPYRAVGVDSAMMLAFRCDMLNICGRRLSSVMIALSPTPISQGGGFVALWGEDLSNEAENRTGFADSFHQVGADPTRKDHVHRRNRYTAAALKAGGGSADAGKNGQRGRGSKTNID